jgi:hypothetical protein
MTSPEAYIYYSPENFTPDGEVTDESTEASCVPSWRSSVIT